MRERCWIPASALFLTVLLLIGCGGSPPPDELELVRHSVASVQTFRLQGKSAEATWSTTDSSGCIVTSVLLFGAENTTRTSASPPQDSIRKGIIANRFNTCTGFLLLDLALFADLKPSELSVSPNLDRATLKTSITGTDNISGNMVTLSIDVSWSGVGKLNVDPTSFQFRAPGLFISGAVVGKSRNAVATGSVLLANENLTPGPSVIADLAASNSHELTIEK